MMKLKLISALCLMISISAVALAAGETLDLGPASVSLDLGNIGSSIFGSIETQLA